MDNQRRHCRPVTLLTGLVSALVVVRVVDDQATLQQGMVFEWQAIEKCDHRFRVGKCSLVDGHWWVAGRRIFVTKEREARLAKGSEEHDVFAAEQLRVVVLENVVHRLLKRGRWHFSQDTVVADLGDLRLAKALPACLLDEGREVSECPLSGIGIRPAPEFDLELDGLLLVLKIVLPVLQDARVF